MAVTETQTTVMKMDAARVTELLNRFASSSASQITTTFISVILKDKKALLGHPADERSSFLFAFPHSGTIQSSWELDSNNRSSSNARACRTTCPLWLLVYLVNSIVLVLF